MAAGAACAASVLACGVVVDGSARQLRPRGVQRRWVLPPPAAQVRCWVARRQHPSLPQGAAAVSCPRLQPASPHVCVTCPAEESDEEDVGGDLNPARRQVVIEDVTVRCAAPRGAVLCHCGVLRCGGPLRDAWPRAHCNRNLGVPPAHQQAAPLRPACPTRVPARPRAPPAGAGGAAQGQEGAAGAAGAEGPAGQRQGCGLC